MNQSHSVKKKLTYVYLSCDRLLFRIYVLKDYIVMTNGQFFSILFLILAISVLGDADAVDNFMTVVSHSSCVFLLNILLLH